MNPDQRTITAAILALEDIRRQVSSTLAMLYSTQEQEQKQVRRGKPVSFKEMFGKEAKNGKA